MYLLRRPADLVRRSLDRERCGTRQRRLTCGRLGLVSSLGATPVISRSLSIEQDSSAIQLRSYQERIFPSRSLDRPRPARGPAVRRRLTVSAWTLLAPGRVWYAFRCATGRSATRSTTTSGGLPQPGP